MPKTRPGDAEQAMRRFGLGDEDVAAWHDSGLPEGAFAGWLADRVARRPTGRRAREVYGAEDVHDFARRAILDALAHGPGDHVLEVGCGGGLLLRDALATGAGATGIDHSRVGLQEVQVRNDHGGQLGPPVVSSGKTTFPAVSAVRRG